RVLAVRGQILPSTLENLTLCAELVDEARVEGESQISKSSRPIKRVYLQPEHPAAYPEAMRAILDADLVVIGPGSLYTSVLPNLLVEDLARAVIATNAMKVYVCNVATQRGETDNFRVSDHVEALIRHLPENPIDFVLANDKLGAILPAHWQVSQVSVDGNDLDAYGIEIIQSDVIDPQNPLRHDPKKLAQALMRLYYDRSELISHSKSGDTRQSDKEIRVESA
ncbi:MAG: gluconeogenesis factor YvcK family protein, partial [Chloroflexota bacterium]